MPLHPTEKSQYAIEVVGLTRRFGDFVAVDDLNFNVEKGEVFGFLGANGAGKTTAIRMLTGLLRASTGKALVAGFDINTQSELVKQHIGYMSQRFSLYDDLTIIENMQFFGTIYGLDKHQIEVRSSEILEKLDLGSYKKSLLHGLPLGWKQKLAFSISMLHKPEIVFLDEPTSGVDPVTRRQFWELIYEAATEGTTVFITTHYMDEAEYCDRISIMNRGRIEVMGTPAQVKEQLGVAYIDDAFVRIARPEGG